MPAATENCRELAPAKINLALHVTGLRADRYHELDTIAVFADVADQVALAPSDRLRIAVSGPFADQVPAGAGNLVRRAGLAMSEAADIRHGVSIRLRKNLPAGAGLGGGSADAAAVLRGLNRLWGLDWPLADLAAIGRQLGADVPMCLHAVSLRATGIGEAIRPIPVPTPLPLVIAWPCVSASTRAVFEDLSFDGGCALPGSVGHWQDVEDLAGWLLNKTENMLQRPAMRLVPEIGSVLEAFRSLPQCRFARMTGSGSACFGLFDTTDTADRAASLIKKGRPHWWVRSTCVSDR